MKTCVVLTLFLMAGSSLGDIQKRITGGRDCKPEETKTFVFLEAENTKDSRMVNICSGSVIDDGTWVLTARHCNSFAKPFTIKGNGWTETSYEKYPHTDADIMLIKMKSKTKRTPIALAATEDCDDIKNELNSRKTVEMVLVARHTKVKKQTGGDHVRCGEIKVRKCEQKPEKGPCFTGKNFRWINCWACGGDSGGGYIRKSGDDYKLYGVLWGGKNGLIKQKPYAVSVCEQAIIKWINDTIQKHK